MATALFINGVYEEILADIEQSQRSHPGKTYYLQPYTSRPITHLVKAKPTPENPVMLYVSLSDSLDRVSYSARIVGWQDKREIQQGSAAFLQIDQEIRKFQPSEKDGLYLKGPNGNQCVNLISVVDLKRFEIPFEVSRLIKTSDGMPRKARTQPGGWSYVQELPITAPAPILWEDLEANLQAEVQKSLQDGAEARKQRLANAPKKPERIQVISSAYRRNPDVIADVLSRAKGTCEACLCSAPFFRARDGEPYLEVHHRIMLSAGGEDTTDNAVALCPNCHRKDHFGKKT
jgi:predicted HNH restriction endonuclease